MVEVRNTGCCGLKELDRLGTEETPENAMASLRHWWTGELYQCTFILFSGVTDRVQTDHTMVDRDDDYGQKFADFIETANLGIVVKTAARRNKKTGNNIACWIWTPDHDAVSRWYDEWAKTHPIKDLPAHSVGPTGAIIPWRTWRPGAQPFPATPPTELTTTPIVADPNVPVDQIYYLNAVPRINPRPHRPHRTPLNMQMLYEDYMRHVNAYRTANPAQVARIDGIPIDQLERNPNGNG